DIEFLMHQAVDQVPGEFGIALERTLWFQPPSLIGILIFRSGANREGWHRIEEEVEAVIVIDEDCDVGLLLLHPFPDGLISLEEGLPIGIRIQLPLDRIADRRDVGTADAAD